MELINKTKWDTKSLRKLCLAVIKHKGTEHSKTRFRHRITIITSKGSYHGRASINGSWIKMFVPKIIRTEFIAGSDNTTTKREVERTFDTKTFAQILEHEIEHNLGLRHKEQRNDWWNYDVSYVEKIEVKPKANKPKTTIDFKTIRYQKAIKKVKELTTRLRRTQNLIKKWKRKVNYYEKNK